MELENSSGHSFLSTLNPQVSYKMTFSEIKRIYKQQNCNLLTFPHSYYNILQYYSSVALLSSQGSLLS